ncbi:hypothetical protein KDM41_05950, partial [bacterium]|nr:hypothetical protein [bacterium]
SMKLCQFIDKNKHAISRTRRGVYIAGVRRHMEALADQLDATALSRLAWLFLQEENQEKALKYARMGMERDPMHEHCLRILERLDGGVA